MKLDIYENKISNRIAGYNLMKIGFIAMVVSQFLMIIFVSHLMSTARTIIVPPGLNVATEVTAYRADAIYIKRFARYILGLYRNYTPVSIRDQYSELLTLYSSETYPSAKEEFRNIIDKVESAKDLSSFFTPFPDGFVVDEKKNFIEVKGIRKILNEKETKEELVQTYIIDYAIQDGRFMVKNIKEKGEGS
jgi:conjugal transfer pilus assembly protein TraE